MRYVNKTDSVAVKKALLVEPVTSVQLDITIIQSVQLVTVRGQVLLVFPVISRLDSVNVVRRLNP